MFWNSRGTVVDSQPFIVEGDTHYSFAEVFAMSDEFFNDIKRGVAIIACRKNLETIVLYCGALRNNLVPLLVDADINQSSIIELAELYKAEYILADQSSSPDGYELANTFRTVKMFKRAEVTTEGLHKDLTLLLPTSGSTGDPKCVRLSALNITSATESIVRYMGLTSDRVSISSLPFHYTFGLSVLNCAMHSRSKIVLTDLSWLDRGFWQLAEKENITDLSGVPFMFEVLRRVRLPETLTNSLKCVNQAGGRLEPKLTSHFLTLFEGKNTEYLTMYGQTEASPRISYVPYARAKEKVGSIGIPIDIGTLETDASDKLSEGELIYKGPNVCLGYATNRFDLLLGDENNGVLFTGDVGHIDSEGFATIVGRKKRFAKVFGMSVNLDALESMAKNTVENSAVVARDDLIVVVEAEGRAKELRELLLSKVNFPPRGLKCVSVEELPFKSSGKLDYQKLSNEYL